MNSVLVIDDDKTVRFTMSEILDNNGFMPIETSNGRQAIELLKKERPVAVLLDLKMPGMDGIETMQELKKIDPEIP
ncbi:MAG: response regulator, partial [Nitrospirae bacterium]|nr:response regulator [Nitrospirota bacterium]